MKLSIVVPCYNEEKNIPLILERFANFINRDDIEVILVNNGSVDNSQQVLETLIPHYSFAHTVRVEKNQGYGFGILSGLAATRGEFIGWTHADMQTDPADLLKALHIIEASVNPERVYVKGNRKNRPLFDQIFTSGMSLFETIYMGKSLHDINAQPNVFHRTFFESWENPPPRFLLRSLCTLYGSQKWDSRVTLRCDISRAHTWTIQLEYRISE
ncbi:glycosyltransferase family 2 protein [Cohnella ginsengisoli]|uniref:Glycosyltransferase family 2 protein n=1 Tax=Cohnella ginsengisoli TaxID=425004 RepID=A0A9X4KMQ0_9BACL|nr:glycosyltransferase family 2 protein [Cohnella ginsengisoli]MDG0794536.1 glycosyltransferase family 2 protein [Cohnella ginsengisoli]